MAYLDDVVRVEKELEHEREFVVNCGGLQAGSRILTKAEEALFRRPDLAYKPNAPELYVALQWIGDNQPTKLQEALTQRGEYLSFLLNSALGIQLTREKAEEVLDEIQLLRRFYNSNAIPSVETSVAAYLRNGPLCVVSGGISRQEYGEAIAYARKLGDMFGVSVDAVIKDAHQRRNN